MRSVQTEDVKRWWQQRPPREKLMLAACTLGVVLALGDTLVISPAEKRLRMAIAHEDQLQSRLAQSQSRQASTATVNHQLLAEEQALRQRLEQVQARAGRLQTRLGQATQLPDTLRALVATMGTAKLLELTLADGGTGAGKSDVPTPVGAARPVYHLPITLKVSGSWAELADLLTKIETDAPALQWQQFSLDNSDWPSIQLTLRAQVASLQPRWGSSS